MNDHSAPGSPSIEAVVVAGTLQTRYQRAGSGAPVLLLWSEAEAPRRAQLFNELALRFRVIAPRPPEGSGGRAGPGPGAEWLSHLIDGLGLVRPAVVAAAELAGTVLELSGADPERLGRLVLVRTARHGAEGAGPRQGLGDAADVLLLECPAEGDGRLATGLVARITRFLVDGEGEEALLEAPLR